jgi:hypothetical protein
MDSRDSEEGLCRIQGKHQTRDINPPEVDCASGEGVYAAGGCGVLDVGKPLSPEGRLRPRRTVLS